MSEIDREEQAEREHGVEVKRRLQEQAYEYAYSNLQLLGLLVYCPDESKPPCTTPVGLGAKLQ